MAFHRLSPNLPGYNPFPVGYDFINNPALNGDPGVPALFDGKKIGGPNDGTYFVAFAEDGTSPNFNRMAEALATNTNQLDDYIRKPVAFATRFAAINGAIPLAIIALPEPNGVFLGNGADLLPDTMATLFRVLDANDNEIFDPVSGSKVVVTAIGGGFVGTGFSAGAVTLTVAPPIPAFFSYRVYYGVKKDYTQISQNDFLALSLRNYQASFSALTPGGLDDRYRRNVLVTPGPVNTPGAGRLIQRDGAAPESHVADATATTSFLDPINALWIARPGGARLNVALPVGLGAGSTGYVSYVSRRQVQLAASNEQGAVLSAASFMSVWPHDFSGPITNALTQITPTLPAVLNPGGAAPLTVELNVADYFSSFGTSAVATGYDLLEVTRASGVVETYVISRLLLGFGARRADLTTLDNDLPAVFPANEPVFVRWLSALYQQGNGSRDFMHKAIPGSSSVKYGSMFHAVPSYLTNTPVAGENGENSPAQFFTSATGPLFDNPATPKALIWGGFSHAVGPLPTDQPTYVEKGRLYGDGSVDSDAFITANLLRPKATSTNVAAAAVAYLWSANTDGSLLTISFTSGAPAAHDVTITPFAWLPVEGDQITVVARQLTNGIGQVFWSPAFKFSGLDAAVSPGVGVTTKWTGIYSASELAFLMTKTTY